MPKSEKKWIGVQSYELCARQDGRVAFTVVVQALEIVSQDGDGKAKGHLCSIKQFDFIIALCTAEHALRLYRQVLYY